MACVMELRDQEIYVLKGKKSSGNIKVSHAFRIRLFEPLFINNEINLNESLISFVYDKLQKENIKDRKVHLVVNHRSILSKDFLIPKTDRKKQAFIVDNEMTALFNLTKEFVVDYRILDEVEYEGVKQSHCLASAIRKSTIEGLEIFFEGLDMKIISIESSSNSFLNFVSTFQLNNHADPSICIDASTSYIRFYIFNGDDFMMMRSLNIHVEDEYNLVSKRVLRLLELLDQSQSSITHKRVNQVYLVGFERRLNWMQQLIKDNFELDIIIPKFNVIVNKELDIRDFGNSLGVF